jgi:hypothetical protein
MATVPIEDSAHVTLRLHQTATGELMQIGFSTGVRGEFAISPLVDDLQTWWDDDGSSLVAQVNLDQIVYSEWGVSGFTGFHQVFAKLVNIATGSGAICPPQCAVTVSLLNIQEPADSIKRRRGRMYFGSVPISQLGGDGRLTTGAVDLYESIIPGLQAVLISNASASGDLSGLGIASRAAGLLYSADAFGVGRGVDTQRRRREKVSEEIAYTALAEI